MRLLSRLANLAVKVLGFLLFGFALLALIHGIFGLRVGFNEGRFGFNSDWNDRHEIYRVVAVIPGMPAERAGLQAGDIVGSLNGTRITRQNVNRVFRDALAGSELTFTIRRGDQRLVIRITRQLLPLYRRLVGILFLLLIPMLTMAYLFVGLWGVFKRPSAITRLIAMVCFLIAGLSSTLNVSSASSWISERLYFFQIQGAVSILSLLAPAFWLLLFLRFPQPHPLYRRRPHLTAALVFSLPLSLLACILFWPTGFALKNLGLIVVAAYMGFYFSAGVVVFARQAARETDILKRRQFQLMRFGIKYGVICLLTGFSVLLVDIFVLAPRGIDLDWAVFYVFLLTQLGGLIIPFTFLNSFFGHRILETESALKRRLRYLAASAALLLVYLVAAFNLGRWFVSRLQLRDPSVMVLFILILSLTFAPLNRLVLRWLDQRLYPERNRYRESLRDLIRRLPGFMEAQDLFAQVKAWLQNTMNIQTVHLLAVDPSRASALPFKPASPRSVLNRMENNCCFFWDQLGERERSEIEEEEARWARDNHVSITLPMIARGELVGLLNLGQKGNREDFTGDDLEIFREAADQVAIYLQNIRLQYEYLEKKRLDKEFELARDIQSHLLPQALPIVPGLEIATHYQPCFEVGGDYFDIIPLEGSRTALAIADVSGKGAGAALLMANLQASLKMALNLPASLGEIVTRINHLFHQNALSTQFITFFIGAWDASTRSLEYVNAGHNPPLLHRLDGSLLRLYPTGIGLGIRSDSSYRMERLELQPGDTLTIYTDGIEDFFNPDGQAFGSGRLAEAILRHAGQPPRAFIDLLFRDLDAFAAGERPNDDLTIIVARAMK